MKIRNQMKKWIALLCVLAMVFSYVPSAFADGETEGSESTPVADSTPAQDAAPAPAAAAPDPAPAAAAPDPAPAAAPAAEPAPAAAPAAEPATAPAAEPKAEPVVVDTVENYNSLDPSPTEPVITQTEETVVTTTVNTETTSPVSETVEVQQKTDSAVNEDGSTTVTTETTTTTTTESETTTKTETTTTTTVTYEVKSEGSFVTDSEDVADYIEEQEKAKQEEIQAAVEEKGGSYDFQIDVNKETSFVENSEEFSTKREAEERAEELEGAPDKYQDITVDPTKTAEVRAEYLDNIVGEAIKKVDEAVVNETIEEYSVSDIKKTVSDENSTVEMTFDSQNAAEAFIEAIKEAVENGTDKNVRVINTEITDMNPIGEYSEKDPDRVGYYAELDESKKNEYGQTLYELTIYITGGSDEIEITIPNVKNFENTIWPGDTITYVVTIVNETETEYTIEDYERYNDGPYSYLPAAQYSEELGEQVGTANGGRYIVYQPSTFSGMPKAGSQSYVTDSSYFLWWSGMTLQEVYDYRNRDKVNQKYKEFKAKSEEEKNEIILQYYNYVLKGDPNAEDGYTNFYEGWQDNVWKRLFTLEYNGQSTEDYFENEAVGKVLSDITDSDNKWTINAKFNMAGETDNFYQNTFWSYAERFVLKAVKAFQADVVLDDIDYEVKYNEVQNTYEVEVAGLGTYTVKEEETETEETKLTVVDVKTETVVEKETVPPTPDQPVVPVIPNIPFFPAEIGNNPQGDLLEIDDFMTPLAGSLIMNEGDCIN